MRNSFPLTITNDSENNLYLLFISSEEEAEYFLRLLFLSYGATPDQIVRRV